MFSKILLWRAISIGFKLDYYLCVQMVIAPWEQIDSYGESKERFSNNCSLVGPQLFFSPCDGTNSNSFSYKCVLLKIVEDVTKFWYLPKDHRRNLPGFFHSAHTVSYRQTPFKNSAFRKKLYLISYFCLNQRYQIFPETRKNSLVVLIKYGRKKWQVKKQIPLLGWENNKPWMGN